MPFEFGDVVLVPFPFTNRSSSKQRPAVVVSNLAYNIARPDVVLMAITSQIRANPLIGDVLLRDWRAAGLLLASVAKPVFATLEQAMIIRKLGILTAGDQADVKASIGRILG